MSSASHLSRFLFVLVADLLLRRLRFYFPDSVTRAFADDTAMTVPDLESNAAGIAEMFI